MPGGDGTGPDGLGGFCTPLLESGQVSRPLQRGFYGRGIGRRRCFGLRRWNIPMTPIQPYQPTEEQQKEALENEAKAIEEEQKALNQELEAIKKGIKDLGKQK